MSRILIVDDDSDYTGTLTSLVGGRHEVEVASNGFSALQKLRSGDFDLILLDVVMPGLDGPGFVRESRAMRRDIPIILLSSVPETGRIANRLEIYDFLVKPVPFATLERMIDRLIARDDPA